MCGPHLPKIYTEIGLKVHSCFNVKNNLENHLVLVRREVVFMERASNDATLSKLGDIYQYYVALLECFKLKEDEKILIEVNGDVSKFSKVDSFQMEVKHHLGESLIIDRTIDFWKTLKNWAVEYSRISDFSKLVLFTTSGISQDSLLSEWNEKQKDEKLLIIKSIGAVNKSREDTFRPIYTEIMNANENILLDILSKFEIQIKQRQISKIDTDFKQYLLHIPTYNREPLIGALLGSIINEVKNAPHKWEITYEGFVQILQQTTPAFIRLDAVSLSDEYSDVSPTKEIEQEYQGKFFVQAIKNIQYDREIPKAIADNWRTYMTILSYYKNNPVFNKSLTGYKSDLTEKINYTKNPAKIMHESSERDMQIRESKVLYSTIMSWSAEPFGSINLNRPFFQKGIIHDIVESGKFNWDVGEKDEY